jgi:hypothetical protein
VEWRARFEAEVQLMRVLVFAFAAFCVGALAYYVAGTPGGVAVIAAVAVIGLWMRRRV